MAQISLRLQYALWIFLCVCYVLLAFSPLLSFICALCVLFGAYCVLSSPMRISLGVCIILSGSIIYASRVYFHWEGDDFIRYFQAYSLLAREGFGHINIYGLEAGLPLFYMALVGLFGELSPAGVLFWTILFPSVLFLVWLEQYAMKHLDNANKALCVFFTFLFFDFYIPTEYTRQCISSIFILYALCVKGAFWRYAHIIFALCFHLSAILLLPPLFMLKKYPKFTLLACFGLVVVLSLSFAWLLGLWQMGIISRDTPLFNKLGFYALGFGDFRPNVIELFFITFLGALFLIPSDDSHKKQWRYFVWLFIMLYFSLYLVSGGIAHRATLLLSTILLGFLLFMGFRGFMMCALGFGGLCFIYKCKVLLFGNNAYELWHSYPAYGGWFYYLF
ncbi:EpsG family protein [Helicobacter marmotae]|uniref:EpsG family protein n=1 Tax=Helicobacter marmotae TaxID=152490 RepID=A0A3D8I3Z5_9HELI|nr:EpsG family protein [Helicobacter marmotae]RDU59726.1 hypothetical protein CQA63_05595 [Helicobacter marmotae]